MFLLRSWFCFLILCSLWKYALCTNINQRSIQSIISSTLLGSRYKFSPSFSSKIQRFFNGVCFQMTIEPPFLPWAAPRDGGCSPLISHWNHQHPLRNSLQNFQVFASSFYSALLANFDHPTYYDSRKQHRKRTSRYSDLAFSSDNRDMHDYKKRLHTISKDLL